MHHFASAFDVEWDELPFRAVYLPLPQLTACPINQGFTVGCPGHGRVDSMNGPGLLHVSFHVTVQNGNGTGIQVIEMKSRASVQAADEGEGLAIG